MSQKRQNQKFDGLEITAFQLIFRQFTSASIGDDPAIPAGPQSDTTVRAGAHGFIPELAVTFRLLRQSRPGGG
jgi:hypothetical protein